MAKVTINDIKDLREKTSAGMALCKEALVKSDGDMKKAIEYTSSYQEKYHPNHSLHQQYMHNQLI